MVTDRIWKENLKQRVQLGSKVKMDLKSIEYPGV
jgi:hypothetical protein